MRSFLALVLVMCGIVLPACTSKEVDVQQTQVLTEQEQQMQDEMHRRQGELLQKMQQQRQP